MAFSQDDERGHSAPDLTFLSISELPHCLLFLSACITTCDAKLTEGALQRAHDTMEPVDYMLALFAGVCIGFAGLAFVYGG